MRMEETKKYRIEKDNNNDDIIKNSNGDVIHIVVNFEWESIPRRLVVRNVYNFIDTISIDFDIVGNIEEFAREEYAEHLI
jgi:hypothetical protein